MSFVGNDYTFAFAGKCYQIARADVEAGMRRRPLRLELRLDGKLAALSGRRTLRQERTRSRAGQAKTCSRRPQRRRKEQLDAGFFRSPEPSAMDGGRMKTIWCAGLRPTIFALYSPKQPLGSFTVSRKSSRTGKPSARNGPVSPGDSLRAGRACADCSRSQLRRIGFKQLHQARPRQSCANIP